MRDVFFPAAVAGRNSASGMKLVMFYRSSLLQNSLGSCGVHHRLFDCLLLNMSLSMLMRYFQAVPTCHILLGLLLSSILSFQSLPATLRRQGTKRGSAGGLRLPVPQPVERMRIRGTSEPRWLKGLLIFTYKSPSYSVSHFITVTCCLRGSWLLEDLVGSVIALVESMYHFVGKKKKTE